MVKKNAVDDVIKALVNLPPTVKFVVFGIGPDEKKLRNLVSKLNLTDRVLFRGQISHQEMPKYLKACDIFIRPSRSEGMGNSFVEAMATELPVIATQEGGIADFLFDEIRNSDKETTGWAVDKDNPDDIVLAVQDILQKPDKVKKVVTQAKLMVTKNYDWDLIADRMESEVFIPLFK